MGARVWALALLLLVLGARALRGASPQRLAYQGALGALVLAAMVVELPLGPLDYHLTLVGPVGVLLGPASIFQVVFVANAILALVGHGGLTVVGLNALVLGAGGVLARPVYAGVRAALGTAGRAGGGHGGDPDRLGRALAGGHGGRACTCRRSGRTA